MAINGTKLAKNFRKAASKTRRAALDPLDLMTKSAMKAPSNAEIFKEINDSLKGDSILSELGDDIAEYAFKGIAATGIGSMLFPDDATFKERVGRTAAAVGVAGAGIGAYALHKGAKAAKMGYGGYAKLQGNKAINKIKGFLK